MAMISITVILNRLARAALALAMMTAIAGVATPAVAQEDEDLWDPSWACGRTFTPTTKLIRSISDITGYRGDAKMPPYLVAKVQPIIFGTVIFVKRPTGWIGIAVEQLGGERGSFVAKNKGRASLFTMISAGGPGSELTLIRTTDGWATAKCSTIAFPDTVKPPVGFLDVTDFNATEAGKGAMNGSGEVEVRGDQQTQWFTYATTNGGETWAKPKRIARQPGPLPGIYTRAKDRHVADLIADLKKAYR